MCLEKLWLLVVIVESYKLQLLKITHGSGCDISFLKYYQTLKSYNHSHDQIGLIYFIFNIFLV
jgi:hypothetical protein